jgi:hypothetical protein
MTKLGMQKCVMKVGVTAVVKTVDVLEQHRSNKNITISTVNDSCREIEFKTYVKRYDKIAEELHKESIKVHVRVTDSFGRPMWKEL